jgi:hypothetical protein
MVEPKGIEEYDQVSGWIQRAVKFVGKLPAKEIKHDSAGTCHRTDHLRPQLHH